MITDFEVEPALMPSRISIDPQIDVILILADLKSIIKITALEVTAKLNAISFRRSLACYFVFEKLFSLHF